MGRSKMASEDTARTNVEDIVETTDSDSVFERIINLQMNGKKREPFQLPYSNLGHECFDKMYYKLAGMLPVYALGHNNPEIRRLANELFQALFLNREVNDT
jgi:hypothetical protein